MSNQGVVNGVGKIRNPDQRQYRSAREVELDPPPIRQAECPSAASVGITAEPGYSGHAGLVVWKMVAGAACQLVDAHPWMVAVAASPGPYPGA
jgi:hypothetical protein